MKYVSLSFACILGALSFHVSAITIAKCGNSEGNSYWHNAASNTDKEASWLKDKISSTTTLILTAKGDFDIFVVDKAGNVTSFAQDGGKVYLLRSGTEDATFMHIYPGKVIELYTFWKSRDDRFNFDILQSKGGDQMMYHFSAVMTGKCEYIEFNLIG